MVTPQTTFPADASSPWSHDISTGGVCQATCGDARLSSTVWTSACSTRFPTIAIAVAFSLHVQFVRAWECACVCVAHRVPNRAEAPRTSSTESPRTSCKTKRTECKRSFRGCLRHLAWAALLPSNPNQDQHRFRRALAPRRARARAIY